MFSSRPTTELSADGEGDLQSQIRAQLEDLRLSVGPGTGELMSQEELDAALEEMANLRLSVRLEQTATSDAPNEATHSSGSFYDNVDEVDLTRARAVARAAAEAHQSVRAVARAREDQSGVEPEPVVDTPIGTVQVGIPVPLSPVITPTPTFAVQRAPQQPPLAVASWNCKPNSGKLNKRDMEPLATFLFARVRPAALLLQEPYDFSRLAKTLQLPYRFLPAVGSHAQVCLLDYWDQSNTAAFRFQFTPLIRV